MIKIPSLYMKFRPRIFVPSVQKPLGFMYEKLFLAPSLPTFLAHSMTLSLLKWLQFFFLNFLRAVEERKILRGKVQALRMMGRTVHFNFCVVYIVLRTVCDRAFFIKKRTECLAAGDVAWCRRLVFLLWTPLELYTFLVEKFINKALFPIWIKCFFTHIRFRFKLQASTSITFSMTCRFQSIIISRTYTLLGNWCLFLHSGKDPNVPRPGSYGYIAPRTTWTEIPDPNFFCVFGHHKLYYL